MSAKNKLADLVAKQNKIRDEIVALGDCDDVTKAKNEIDRLNAEFDRNEKEMDTLAKVARAEEQQKNTKLSKIIAGRGIDAAGIDSGTAATAKDRYGRDGAFCLSREEKAVNVLDGVNDTESPLGEMMRAMACGADKYTPDSVMRFFNTNVTDPGAAGGFTVPQPLWANVLDRVRELLVMERAGCRVYSLTSETLSIAVVDQDPTFPTVAEATAINESDVVFRQVLLKLKKLAGITRVSNELMESGINTASTVENTMARALAVAIDQQLLNGDGTGTNILGLFNHPDINKTNLAGPLTRKAIDEAVQAVRSRNHEPMVCVLSPANWHALANEQTTGSGEWLGAPESSRDLTYIPSNSVADTEVCVGDFQYFAWGVQTMLRLEATRQDSESFTKDLTSYRAVARVDGTPTHADAFQIINGIA